MRIGNQMSPNRHTFDDNSPFGTYRPGIFALGLIKVTRCLPTNWLGRRLMFILRRIGALGISGKVDIELFGFPMRLHKEGNVSEKRALFAPQFFDLKERQALASLAKDNAVFIDIGANMALYSFSIAAAFKNFNNTRILAIEPHPIISRRLAYNLSLNPDLPIEPIIAGLGARDGVMKMVTPDNNLGESRLLSDGEIASGEVNEIQVKTLLGLLTEKNIDRLDGMKIDIEGHEEAVLIPFLEQAPEDLLPQLIVIENNYMKWKRDLLALAKTRGYVSKTITRMNVILEKI